MLRHAKSSWDNPNLDDFSRPLAPRGINACKLMKTYIENNPVRPDLILCSSSKRTQETYLLLADAFNRKTEVRFEYDLYESGSQELLKRLRKVDGKVSSVMMIGHNPGLEHLALVLTSGKESKPLAKMREKFPTLALASIKISKGGWISAGPGRAKLKEFITPHDLDMEFSTRGDVMPNRSSDMQK